ncbi:MAG: ABC transporter substrate-binding protein [Candidatus Bathyarchaeia archaeon]
MSEQSKKVSRRKYIAAGGAVAAAAVIGGAAYYLWGQPGAPAPTTPPPTTPPVTTPPKTTPPPTTPPKTTPPPTTPPATTPPITGKTLIYDVILTPETLDPHVCWGGEAARVVFAIYQNLLFFKDGVSPEIVPCLAESYTISEDGTTFTFKIRKNVTFSNGDPMNAYCFWYSFYRSGLINYGPGWVNTVSLGDYPARDGITAEMLNMWNKPDNTPPDDQMELVTNGNITLTCPDPYTLVIRLPEKFAPFIGGLTQFGSSVVSPRWVTEHGGVEAGSPNEYMTIHAMGTGPFMVTRHEPNVLVVLERNPNYWGGPGTGVHNPPKVDKIIIRAVPDALTRLQDVERGAADIADLTPDAFIDAKAKGMNLYYGEFQPTVVNVSLNVRIFDKLTRQAIVRAIDYDQILEMWHGLAFRYIEPIPNGFRYRDPTVPYYERDLNKAKALLAEAGHPNGEGIPEATLLYATDQPNCKELAEIVQANLSEIGIKVKLEGVTGLAQINILCNPDLMPQYAMSTIQWDWYADEWCFVDWKVGKTGWFTAGNNALYENPAVEELLKQVNSTYDEEERRKLYSQISWIVYEDAPYIPAFQKQCPLSGPVVYRDGVTGITVNFTNWGHPVLTEIDIVK